MTIQEAIQARHSVRQYLQKPLTEEQKEQLNHRIAEINQQANLHLQLVLDDPKAFDGRLAHYGKFSGVENLIALVGKKQPTLSQRLGYYGAELCLAAQMMGLNTCWVGLTYSKTENMHIGPDEAIKGVMCIGHGATQGQLHPMKTATKIAPGYQNAPEWFRRGIDTVLLAPSALNQFRVTFRLAADGSVEAKPGFSPYAKMDVGIFRYYFELGAGKENFRWAEAL
jgi:nitroreductase